jgi:CHAD domain-containing protein
VQASPRGATAENARRIVATRVDELLDLAGAIHEAGASRGQHDLRIAAKRLRYSLELFPRVFGAAGEAAVETLRAVQDDLGELHDLDVLLDLIADELRVVADEETALVRAGAAAPARNTDRAGLLAFMVRIAAMRAERHAALAVRWDELVAEGFEERLRALARA